MIANATLNDQSRQGREQQSQAIRFPLPAAERGSLPLWQALLPSRWRRQVVIQGQRYWRPG